MHHRTVAASMVVNVAADACLLLVVVTAAMGRLRLARSSTLRTSKKSATNDSRSRNRPRGLSIGDSTLSSFVGVTTAVDDGGGDVPEFDDEHDDDDNNGTTDEGGGT